MQVSDRSRTLELSCCIITPSLRNRLEVLFSFLLIRLASSCIRMDSNKYPHHSQCIRTSSDFTLGSFPPSAPSECLVVRILVRMPFQCFLAKTFGGDEKRIETHRSHAGLHRTRVKMIESIESFR